MYSMLIRELKVYMYVCHNSIAWPRPWFYVAHLVVYSETIITVSTDDALEMWMNILVCDVCIISLQVSTTHFYCFFFSFAARVWAPATGTILLPAIQKRLGSWFKQTARQTVCMYTEQFCTHNVCQLTDWIIQARMYGNITSLFFVVNWINSWNYLSAVTGRKIIIGLLCVYCCDE